MTDPRTNSDVLALCGRLESTISAFWRGGDCTYWQISVRVGPEMLITGAPQTDLVNAWRAVERELLAIGRRGGLASVEDGMSMARRHASGR